MSNIVKINEIEAALIQNDLSKLTTDQRLSYYKSVCESVGLNPLTQPFAYLNLNGKLTLYAKRDATDQLRKVHSVSVTISCREKIDDVYIVTAKAKDKDGREDESTGAVFLGNLKGDALANAFLKAETKAKRRVTLSICGLGLMDETEVETIPNAQIFNESTTSEGKNENYNAGQKQIIHESSNTVDRKPVSKTVDERPVDKTEPTRETGSGIKNEAPISVVEAKNIYDLVERKGRSIDNFHKYLKSTYDVERANNLKKWQYAELMTMLSGE